MTEKPDKPERRDPLARLLADALRPAAPARDGGKETVRDRMIS